MPTRMIRDGILTSERVALLNFAEEVFYRRLLSVVDDYGRFYALPALIRAACYPLQLDKVSDSDIGKWLLVTGKAGLVRVYPASDGKRYLEVQDFGQRIQSKSKFPAPPPIDGDSQSTTVVHGESPKPTAIVEGVVVVEGGDTRKRARATKTPLPDDFGISPSVEAWAARKGHTRLAEHLEAFKAKARANGYTYADWDSAFQEAIRGDWAKLAVVPARQSDQGSPAASRRLA